MAPGGLGASAQPRFLQQPCEHLSHVAGQRPHGRSPHEGCRTWAVGPLPSESVGWVAAARTTLTGVFLLPAESPDHFC